MKYILIIFIITTISCKTQSLTNTTRKEKESIKLQLTLYSNSHLDSIQNLTDQICSEKNIIRLTQEQIIKESKSDLKNDYFKDPNKNEDQMKDYFSKYFNGKDYSFTKLFINFNIDNNQLNNVKFIYTNKRSIQDIKYKTLNLTNKNIDKESITSIIENILETKPD